MASYTRYGEQAMKHAWRVYLAVVLVVMSVLLVFGMLWALHNDKARLVFWLLVAVVVAVLASFLTSLYFSSRLERMRQECDQVKSELEQVRKGKGLTKREHMVLLLRLAGITLETMSKVVPCSRSTIDEVIRGLKSKGILKDGE
jgi:Na+/melibiose symporter-like transporter